MDYKITYKDDDPHIVRNVHHWDIDGGEWPFINFRGQDGSKLASFNLRWAENVSALVEVSA